MLAELSPINQFDSLMISDNSTKSSETSSLAIKGRIDWASKYLNN